MISPSFLTAIRKSPVWDHISTLMVTYWNFKALNIIKHIITHMLHV